MHNFTVFMLLPQTVKRGPLQNKESNEFEVIPETSSLRI
jgi:hypothetical protein